MFPKKILSVSLMALLTLSGCRLLPSPDKTIVPSREKPNISVSNKNINSIVGGFLSETAFLEPVAGSTEAIELRDIDGDKNEEIVFTYKDSEKNITSAIKILKKDPSKWSEYFKQEYTPIDGLIKTIGFNDITGDNVPEIFITNVRGLDLFVHRMGHWDRILSTQGGNTTPTYEIRDIQGPEGGDGTSELIVRTGTFRDFRIEASRWNGYTLTNVDEEYPDLFNEEVNIFETELKATPNSTELWFKLIEAQKKAGKYEDALRSIEKKLSLNNSPRERQQFQYLKAKVLIILKKYNEALALSEIIKKEADENTENLFYQDDFTIPILIAQKQYDKARDFYKSTSKFPYDTSLQELDAIIAKEKIMEYIRRNGLSNLDKTAEELSSWGAKHDIIIECQKTQYTGNKLPRVLVLDYHISPEKAFGKDTVGGHIFFWVEDGKLYEREFSVIQAVSDHHYAKGLKAREVQAYMEGSYFKIKVRYENTASIEWLPEKFDQVFMIQNNKLKFTWK